MKPEHLGAIWALLVARARVLLLPTGKLIRTDPVASPAVSELTRADAIRLAGVVDRAARGPLRSTCLVRAVALQHLLRSHGAVGSQIRLGVRSDPDGISAHAWVEYLGTSLGADGSRSVMFRTLGRVYPD